MPNMANITVKKKDGTTDVTWTQLTPSAGDKTPARWSQVVASARANLRPTFESQSRFNANRTARNISFVLKYPEIVQVNGVDTVFATAIMNMQAVVPTNMSSTAIDEFAAQLANTLKASLPQEIIASGYAPA